MKLNWRSVREWVLLPTAMGLTDGILTALILAAGILTSNKGVTLSLAMRVAASSFFSGAFVYFVAKYAGLRQELIHAELELSLGSHGQLAMTNLGKAIMCEAAISTIISSVAAFLGSLCPLIIAASLPHHHWASIVASLIALGLFGAVLAKALYGSIIRWSVSLVAGGALLTVIGIRLAILQ